MAAPVSLALATSVLLPDGAWHDLARVTDCDPAHDVTARPAAGQLGAVIDPSFTDPQTGQAITPGEPWVQFTDTTGQAWACPMRCIQAVKLAGPVTPAAQTGPTAVIPGL